MKNNQLDTIMQKMSEFTSELGNILEEFSDVDFQKFTKAERTDFLNSIEQLELLTSKAEALAKKTSREGIPEIVANQIDKKLDNKFENKPAPKKRIANLMKPSMNNTYSSNKPTKKEE